MNTAQARLHGRVGAVYTMGALHDGHLALVAAARAENDAVVATLFVNPLQFAADEDLAAYPRDYERDIALFERAGVDVLFMPTPDVMYPPGFSTRVTVRRVSAGLEGAARPRHFRGVATVVAKLFHLTQPRVAYFGQKDAQQVVVIRQMARDLNFPLDIAVMPTVREADGLAMSSRNTYLKPDERQAAAILHRSIEAAAEAYDAGERNPSKLAAMARTVIEREPLAQLDYISLNDPRDLRPMRRATDKPMLLSMAAQVGKPRLLDNALLPFALNTRDGLTRWLGGAGDSELTHF